MVSFLARYNQPVMVQLAMITNFGFGLTTTISNARLILTRFSTSMNKITLIEIGDKSPSTIPNMEAKINNGQLMVAKSNPMCATWDWTYLRGVLRLEQTWDVTKKMMLPTNSGVWSIVPKDVAQWYLSSQTMLTSFWLFSPPTPLRWHLLPYKHWQKIDIFELHT